MSTKTGVYPLVCATCHCTVGVINVAEFEALARAGEVYICHICMDTTEPDTIEVILETAPEGEWAEITMQTIAAGIAEPVLASEVML